MGCGGSYGEKFVRLWEPCISLPLFCEGVPHTPMASANRRDVFLSKWVWVHLWDAIIRICLNFRLQRRDVSVSFEQACVMAAMKHPVGWLILLFSRSSSLLRRGHDAFTWYGCVLLKAITEADLKLFWKILVKFGVQQLIWQNLASELS